MSIIGDPLLLGGGGSGGEGAGVIIEDAPDAAGGTVRTITAVEISGTKTISQNGVEDVTEYAAVNVAVPAPAPTLQTKTNISPTEGSQTIEADVGYDGLSSVQINAIPSSYVGSGVTRRSSSDLSISGPTVTAPAGYYSSAATLSVPVYDGSLT